MVIVVVYCFKLYTLKDWGYKRFKEFKPLQILTKLSNTLMSTIQRLLSINSVILKGVDLQDNKLPHELDFWRLAFHMELCLNTSIFQSPFI